MLQILLQYVTLKQARNPDLSFWRKVVRASHQNANAMHSHLHVHKTVARGTSEGTGQKRACDHQCCKLHYPLSMFGLMYEGKTSRVPLPDAIESGARSPLSVIDGIRIRALVTSEREASAVGSMAALDGSARRLYTIEDFLWDDGAACWC